MPRRALLLLAPLCIVALVSWVQTTRGPFWLVDNSDPSYHYLLNSLKIVELDAPTHVDNPGTPLQVVGAVVIYGVHLFRDTASTRLDVLQNPGLYLEAIHGTVTGLLGAALLLAGLITLKATNSMVLAVVIQCSPLLPPATLPFAGRLMPEPLLLGLATLACAVALAYLSPVREANPNRDLGFAVAFGALVGVGMATKVTFAALAVMPLVLLRGIGPRLLYFLAVPVTFVVATRPAAASFPIFLARYQLWITHTGRDGFGDFGLWEAANVIPLGFVLVQSIVLPLFLVVSTVIIMRLWRRGRKASLIARELRVQRGLLAIVAVAAVTAVLILKQPRYHYSFPLLCCLGLGAILCFEATQLGSRKLRRFGATFALLMIGSIAVWRAAELYHWRSWRVDLTRQLVAVSEEANTRYATAAKVYFYRASSKAYAFHRSSLASLGYCAEDLRRIYPRSYMWDLWLKEYWHFDRPVSLEQIAAGNSEVVFQGETFPHRLELSPELSRSYGWPPGLLEEPPKGGPVEVVFAGEIENLYKFKSEPVSIAPGAF